MIYADLIRAFLTVTIPYFAFHWLPGVFLCVFLIATASTLFMPAKQSLLPNLVPANLLLVANSLVSSSEKTMELLGYSIAGVIAAAVSWLPLFLIDAATYLVSAMTLLGVPDVTRVRVEAAFTVLRDIKEGTRFILSNRKVGSIMGVTAVATIFGGMILPILVVLAYGQLRSGAVGYGLIEAAVGAGAVVGALLVPRLMGRTRAGTLILLGVVGIGLTQSFTGLATVLATALVFLFIQGVASTVYYVPMISVIQREAPDHIRGRVMATRFLLVQAGLLIGMAVSGPLTEILGAPLVFFVSGLLIVCVAAVGATSRQLRQATLGSEPSAQLAVRAAAAS
jgi:MFS family permease